MQNFFFLWNSSFVLFIPNSEFALVGLSGLEPETSPLSEARSNQLS